MDQRNKASKTPRNMTKNNKIYMDLKEILREQALRYLPAKALHRSLSVCREWKLQISTPFFAHNQSNSFRSISGLFYQLPGCRSSFLSLDHMAYGVPDPELKFLPEQVDIRSSCNGLLLCQGQNGDRPYYVCNPVNGEWKKLPKPINYHGAFPAVVLDFQPSLLNFTADFKVVCIFPSTDFENAYEFEIYSSSQDAWKVSGEMYFLGERYTDHSSFPFSRGINANGVIYWQSAYGKTLIFDLKTERASEIYDYSSSHGHGASNSFPFGAHYGKLSWATVSDRSVTVRVLDNLHVNTMPMASARKQSWAVKHSGPLSAKDLKLEPNQTPRVLLSWDDAVVFQAGSRAFSYDIKTKSVAELSSNGKIRSGCVTFPYVNSLVSLA